jgi:hypothetical protein
MGKKLTESIYDAIQRNGDDFITRSKREIVTVAANGKRYDVRPGFMKAHFEGHADAASYIRLEGKKSWGDI